MLMRAGIVILSVGTVFSTQGVTEPQEDSGPDIVVIAEANNPDPAQFPTLRFVKEKMWGTYYPILSMTFPNVPEFSCDAWCYESEVEFLSASPLPEGALEIRHRDKNTPSLLVVTTVTPRPGAVELVARVVSEQEGAAPAGGITAPPGLNVCWQFRHAPAFASKPDPYPAFFKRCFLFTHTGLTFLCDTEREKIPVQSPDAEANNPPWVQMYVPSDVPRSVTPPNSWAGTSPDRYLIPIIGVVSRDQKYLAAVANDSAQNMSQAWHDCLHNNPKWLPEDAPLADRCWRVTLYVLENDPKKLLQRAGEDFPSLKSFAFLAEKPSVEKGWQAVATPESWVAIPENTVWLKTLPLGPFVRLADGRLLTVDGNQVFASADEGKSWDRWALSVRDSQERLQVGTERSLLRTSNGTLVLVFMNMENYKWAWDAEKRLPSEDTRLPVWAIRSTDDGKTWTDARMIYDGYCGDIHDILQTRNGTIIAPVQELLYEDGRHALRPRYSTDEGKTWHRSNLLDIGGRGHHDGLIEGTLAERADGTVWLLCRTNLGRFWSAFSDNDGKSFRVLTPSDIPSASSPGTFKRLSSGRLLLVWNRPAPDGADQPPAEVIRGGDGQWSDVPVSNYRAELSVAFSSDDGKTWSTPRVIARRLDGLRNYLAYTYVFEPQPGEVWITTMQGGVRLSLLEKDWID